MRVGGGWKLITSWAGALPRDGNPSDQNPIIIIIIIIEFI